MHKIQPEMQKCQVQVDFNFIRKKLKATIQIFLSLKVFLIIVLDDSLTYYFHVADWVFKIRINSKCLLLFYALQAFCIITLDEVSMYNEGAVTFADLLIELVNMSRLQYFS